MLTFQALGYVLTVPRRGAGTGTNALRGGRTIVWAPATGLLGPPAECVPFYIIVSIQVLCGVAGEAGALGVNR